MLLRALLVALCAAGIVLPAAASPPAEPDPAGNCRDEVVRPELWTAREALADKIARYNRMLQALRDDTLPDPSAAPELARMLAERAALRARVAALATLIDPERPERQALDAEAARLEQLLAAELERVLRGLHAEIDTAQQQLAELEERLKAERRACAPRSL